MVDNRVARASQLALLRLTNSSGFESRDRLATANRSLVGQMLRRLVFPKMIRSRPAFTLVELMTVVSVIGILAVIVMPTVRSATTRASGTALLERVRVIRIAVASAEDINPDSLNAPPGEVPGVLREALASGVMHGEEGIAFQLSGQGREIWLTLSAVDGRTATILEHAYAEALREGLSANYQGFVMHVALNGAAASTMPPQGGVSAATPATSASATSSPAQPTPASVAAPDIPGLSPPTADGSPRLYTEPSTGGTPEFFGAMGVHSCNDFVRQNIAWDTYGDVDLTVQFCEMGVISVRRR